MTELRFRHTDLLDRTLEAIQRPGVRVVVNEGGSGSSKTYSLAQAHILLSFQEEGKVYTVVRDALPALRRSALRDFRSVLSETGAGSFFDENRSAWSYKNRLTGTEIEFVAFDTPQKARGPRRDRLWLNEANEMTEETTRQLMMRTRLGITLDYNPSMQRHWIYDKVLTRPDAVHITSTYRVNAFLSPDERREIENDVPAYEEADGTRVKDWDLTYQGEGHLVSGDPYRWAVFGLGRRGSPSEAIYPVAHASHGFADWQCYGLDFGYNHPTVLLAVGRRDVDGGAELHFDEILFASYLTTDDLIEEMKARGVSTALPIYADGSRPESIEQIERADFNIQPADKGPGSVYAGIQFVKGHRLHFTARSERSKAQFEDYRWQKRPDGTIDDKPVKLADDAPDAGRYGAFTHWNIPEPSAGYRSFW